MNEKSPTQFGWRVGEIYRIHHAILLYSFEPPTALVFNAVFYFLGVKIKMIFWVFLLCMFTCSLDAAVLNGYGEVEGCYTNPDEKIPTCDGSAYGVYQGQWCYIPSMGCNMPIVVEGYVSPEPTKTGKLHENIPIITLDEFVEKYSDVGAYSYCKMIYPYEGFYVGQFSTIGMAPFDNASYCYYLYRNDDSYSCYQDKSDADDRCSDDSDGLFENIEEEAVFLASLFATEMPSEVVCEIGITSLMVSNGQSFQLYAEKYTEPSLVIKYNDQKCYVKLQAGQASDAINVNYNGSVYHTIQ